LQGSEDMPKKNSIKSLKKLSRLKEYAHIRDRLLAVIFHFKGKGSVEIGERLDRSHAWVIKWVRRFSEAGLDGLENLPRSGQPSLLDENLIQKFKDRIEKGALAKDNVSVLRGEDIRKILKEEFGAEYSLSGVYDLLARVKFSKVKPRPKHEKNDLEAMREWKEKKFPLFTKRSQKNIPIKVSKSGSKTKLVTVKKDA
jgi:transposase